VPVTAGAAAGSAVVAPYEESELLQANIASFILCEHDATRMIRNQQLLVCDGH
jgi:hypothetical protein